ncbi:3-oxo-Delta(4,5)-steroid 5-beta-reductase [Cucurbita argyrosperma subsp. argyrosperma]|nr:3-oxo-Delta(4,5)-steroid 5-beta-reductase [Cucurbita argyrosperma subsp. argyrosperma]
MRKNEAFNDNSLDVFKRTHSWRVLEEQFGMEEYVFISNLAFAFFTGKQGTCNLWKIGQLRRVKRWDSNVR